MAIKRLTLSLSVGEETGVESSIWSAVDSEVEERKSGVAQEQEKKKLMMVYGPAELKKK